MKFLTGRIKHRILYHYLIIAFICGALFSILFLLVPSKNIKFRLSIATGYIGFALLGVTLIIGALNILRNRRNPISSDLRRDIGIWCGFFSLAHVVFGIQIHMGNMLLYFFREAEDINLLVPRIDLFGFANYTGLLTALIILFLLALSNDASLRLLKSSRWKFWQRLNYVVLILVVLHSVAYQIIEKRQSPYLIVFGSIILTVLILQVWGFWRYRQKAIETS